MPASIGNLGSGFDALSIAVQIYLRVWILDLYPESPARFETESAAGPVAGGNGLERAFRYACARGRDDVPGVRIRVESEIPIHAGLGSSAAATVAALRVYQALTTTLQDDALLAMACALEGHPDNAAACLLGGLTVSCRSEDGGIVARSSPWPQRVQFAIATPRTTMPTERARAVLPSSIPLPDAVFNLQRALLLLAALRDDRLEDLREAFRDRWHQPARAALVPGLREALQIDHPAVLAVCLSGSGPSIAAVAAPGRETEAADALSDVYRRLDLPFTMRIVAAHQPGAARAVSIDLKRESTT